MFQSPPMTPLSRARFIVYEVRSVLLAHCSAEVSPLPGVAASRKTGLEADHKQLNSALTCFSPLWSPIVPATGAETGPRDPSLVQDRRAATMASAPETGLSGGGALIQREVEKMFCSDPIAEQRINTAQTEEGKVMHLENVSC